MTGQPFYYGAFQLADGVNYYVLSKDLSLPAFKQTLFQIARLEGSKLTGSRQNEKPIPVTMKVVGTSRADLEAKIDALLAALALRQQQLTLHTEDARYYIADCVSAQVRFTQGQVVGCTVALQFVAEQPFAYAASPSSYSSGALVMAAGSSSTSWNLPSGSTPLSITGGGNTFARPTLTILNQTAANATTLTSGLTNGSPYTSLSVAALPAAATTGQVFLLVSGTHSQRVTLSANASLGATSISVTSFNANFSYPSASFCGLDIYLQNFTLAQNPDGQVLMAATSALGVQTVGNGQSLVIDCDPTTPNGETVIPSSTNTPIAFVGSFPVIEPTNTQFTLTVTCSNQPTLLVQAVWTPRWLA